MRVRVLMFAGAREAVDADHIEVDVPHGATFADLEQALGHEHPRLRPLLPAARFAADAGYVTPAEPVDPNAEIALIPAVSGG